MADGHDRRHFVRTLGAFEDESDAIAAAQKSAQQRLASAKNDVAAAGVTMKTASDDTSDASMEIDKLLEERATLEQRLASNARELRKAQEKWKAANDVIDAKRVESEMVEKEIGKVQAELQAVECRSRELRQKRAVGAQYLTVLTHHTYHITSFLRSGTLKLVWPACCSLRSPWTVLRFHTTSPTSRILALKLVSRQWRLYRPRQ